VSGKSHYRRKAGLPFLIRLNICTPGQRQNFFRLADGPGLVLLGVDLPAYVWLTLRTGDLGETPVDRLAVAAVRGIYTGS
jgi:hypothetical protein